MKNPAPALTARGTGVDRKLGLTRCAKRGNARVDDWAAATRAEVLDLARLLARQQPDFEIHTGPASVRTHEGALRELSRNLLHDAIKHSHAQGRPGMNPTHSAQCATPLAVGDSGPGVSADLWQRRFQPVACSHPHNGSGLGSAICREIVLARGGTIHLDNRTQHGRFIGRHAVVCLTLADNGVP